MNPASADELLVRRRDRSAWITLNRPHAMNALTPSLMSRLMEVLDAIRDDRQVISVVITGSGKTFCAGVDLAALGAQRSLADGTQDFMRVATPVITAMEGHPKPIVAMVNGLALAGGLELVLGCDLVYASSKARFGDAHANFGLIPGGGSSARLPRRIGLGPAKELILTGALADADTMLRYGLVNRVFEPQHLEAGVLELLGQLNARSPLGLARSKRLVMDGMELPLAEAVTREAAIAVEHCLSHDAKEGVTAFAAKRTPVFDGT